LINAHQRHDWLIGAVTKRLILRMGLTREDIGYSVAKLLHAIVAACR